MASNEARAKLIGRTWMHLDVPCEGDGHAGCGLVPWDPEHDANAVAELRAFVRARGKIKRFQLELWNVVLGCVPLFEPSYEQEFNLLDATPQQLCAAFDATFKDELEKIQ